MSRILITGASGFIGKALCASLLQRGYGVRRALRNGEMGTDQSQQEGPSNVETVIVGNITSKTDWSQALEKVDIVVHLAARVHVMRETAVDSLEAFRAVNLEGTRNLAWAAARAGVRRIVYISSIGVNGNHTTGKPFSEEDVPAPYSPYTVSKFEAEQVLSTISAKGEIETVVIRPPLVYGPGNPGNFLRLLKLVARGIPLPLASVNNQRSMIYLGNLVDALGTCATHPEAADKTYLVSDGEEISTAFLIHELARLMGKSSCLWSFPPSLLSLTGRLVGKTEEVGRVLGSLVIDSSKIRRELQWTPPFSMGQGLVETVRWFQEQSGHV